jgi:phosphoesterase RecJ-like protein
MSNMLMDAIAKADTVAIGGHVRPDGDCVGSCLALYNYMLDNFGMAPDVYLEPIPESYQRVRGFDKVISDFSEDKSYDLFIVFDCSEKGRLGDAVKYFEQAKHTVCIDHHINQGTFADENQILSEASSASEVLYDFLDPDKISLETADCLYMGMMCDTGCFKYSCTSEKTMRIAGKLISIGVNTSKMMDEIFYQKTYKQNLLLGRCLLNSHLELDGKCIMCSVPLSLLDEYEAASSDLEGIIDQMRLTKGVEVAVLMTENKEGQWKLSLRSCEYVDVQKIVSVYGGGGHVHAAGATVADAQEVITKDLLARIGEVI